MSATITKPNFYILGILVGLMKNWNRFV